MYKGNIFPISLYLHTNAYNDNGPAAKDIFKMKEVKRKPYKINVVISSTKIFPRSAYI